MLSESSLFTFKSFTHTSKFFIVLIKSTNFKGEQVYIQYNNEGLSQFADSLVAKKIIFEKSSFLLLANVFKVEDRIKPGKFLIKRKNYTEITEESQH